MKTINPMHKTKMMLVLMAFCITALGYSQLTDPTTTANQPTKSEQTTAANPPQTGTPKPEAKTATTTSSPCEKCCDKDLTTNQKTLVMMPVFFLILIVFITIWAAKRAGYNFSQAFYTENPEEIIESAPTPTDPNAVKKTTLLDVNGLPVYMPSSSRLIAFLTSLTTLIVITSFISYYAYSMMKCRELPDFKNLFEVVIALGLGIVPYGINKLASSGKQ